MTSTLRVEFSHVFNLQIQTVNNILGATLMQILGEDLGDQRLHMIKVLNIQSRIVWRFVDIGAAIILLCK